MPLTTHEAAQRVGVQPVTIRNNILRGTLPATKAGRDWLIEPGDLETWAQKRGYTAPFRLHFSIQAKD